MLQRKVTRETTVVAYGIRTLLVGRRYDGTAAAAKWISIDEGAEVIVLSDAGTSRTSQG